MNYTQESAHPVQVPLFEMTLNVFLRREILEYMHAPSRSSSQIRGYTLLDNILHLQVL